MKLGKKFNTLTYQQYVFALNHHKEYSDWNTLGLYRSIVENEKLDVQQKIAVRDLANTFFAKTFEFLQIKDGLTYFKLITLGEEDLTYADENQIWVDIKKNQERLLKEKKIRHRSFGDYSKHECGYDHCPLNGIMVKSHWFLANCTMHFDSDKNRWEAKKKSNRLKKERRNKQDYGDEIQDYLDDKA